MNTSGNQQKVWNMINRFIQECKELYNNNIISIILTGSLANGSQQCKLNDFDLITVLDDEVSDNVKNKVTKLYHGIEKNHNIRFEPIVFKLCDFWPPWDSRLCIQLEILKLKANAKVLYGKDIITEIPTPTKREMWEFERSLREWSSELEDETTWQDWTLESSLRIILEHAALYFYYKTGIYEYRKNSIADIFSQQFPHFIYLSSLKIASYFWRHYPEDVNAELRLQMAEQAREFEDYIALALSFEKRRLIR